MEMFLGLGNSMACGLISYFCMNKEHIQKIVRPQILDSLDSDLTWAIENLMDARRTMTAIEEAVPAFLTWPESQGCSIVEMMNLLKVSGYPHLLKEYAEALQSCVGILRHSALAKLSSV